LWGLKSTKRTITLYSLKIMESFDNRFTSQLDFNFFLRPFHWTGKNKGKLIKYNGWILSWRMSSYLSIPLFLRNGELLGYSPIHNQFLAKFH
jgi:hypothetical protein